MRTRMWLSGLGVHFDFPPAHPPLSGSRTNQSRKVPASILADRCCDFVRAGLLCDAGLRTLVHLFFDLVPAAQLLVYLSVFQGYQTPRFPSLAIDQNGPLARGPLDVNADRHRNLIGQRIEWIGGLPVACLYIPASSVQWLVSFCPSRALFSTAGKE